MVEFAGFERRLGTVVTIVNWLRGRLQGTLDKNYALYLKPPGRLSRNYWGHITLNDIWESYR